ncbi:translocation/assembly module TamB [Sphingomonas ginkgonis]|uniref:Translocation/assembly module TamB n=2 Tax=Sphingomonas ginkgonis TaxID=2315330 RepID=A0A429VEC5_9SPHN|nr:translocation/assembly module TamB [Sphingomonas ginkgonis]
MVALLVSLLLLAAGGLVFLDTAPGHRFIVDRLGALETASGLRIRIGRIDGSVFGVSHLRSVEVSDPRGVFLTAPDVVLDWSPGAWLTRGLMIDRLTAQRVILLRRPALRPTGRRGRILPDFNIHLGELGIERLELATGVTGTPRTGSLAGSAEIRAGRALIELRAAFDRGGDRAMLLLDAEPDRDRFDLQARVRAPADGLLPALVGMRRPMQLDVGGSGSWTRWGGRALLDLSGRPAARLLIGASAGRYSLAGRVAVAPYATGKLQRLTAPMVTLRGEATLRDRRVTGRLVAATPELRAVARGTLDLARNAYDGVNVGLDLLRPAALFPNMRGEKVRLVWTLDGPFDTATYAYRLTSPAVTFDTTGFVDVRAEGRGRLSAWPLRLPLRLQARRITGIGDAAGQILANARLEGLLAVTPRLVRGDRLAFTSDKLNGRVSLMLDLASGRFDILISGGLTRYRIPGLGIVDVTSELRVLPGANGRNRVAGRGEAWVRRLDNRFFAELAGGLPHLTTDLARGEDGVLHFTNLRLSAPWLAFVGAGYRRRDGTFHIEGSGRQARYGPFRLVLDGPIERPRIELLLARPNDGLGLAGVRLSLLPSGGGFDYRAAGGSSLGAFTSIGQILLPPGGPTSLVIASLAVGGTEASGRLRSDPGGFSGQLGLAGALAGELQFAPEQEHQRIDAHLTANDATLAGVTIQAGRIDGTVLLIDGRTTVTGVLNARGVSAGALAFSRVQANASLVNGRGQVRAAVAGTRGRGFDFSVLADVSPDRIVLTGRGNVERRPLVLQSAAVITRDGDGWAIAPTRVQFAGGTATMSGRTGERPQLSAELSGMPLGALAILVPGLGLEGVANGRIDYAWNGGRPTGRANLLVRGLARSGLTLASRPIDVGIAAVLTDGQAAVRAVAADHGQVIGRAQARFSPLSRQGPIVAQLLGAPLFAQLRYSGPADTLWRLSGVRIVDLGGPVAVGADIGGRLLDPQIRGSIRATGARLESAVTGLVVTDLQAHGSFAGSRLVFDQLGGATPGGGSISGRGKIDFSGGSPSLDLAFNAANARMIDRDDIAAQVTGPLTIRSNGGGGRIGGDFKLNRGRFTLGRAGSTAGVPTLQVRHTGLDTSEEITLDQLHPWTLDLKLDGGNLDVRGLGISSLWTTRLAIGGTVDAPRFTGTANLVRGDYDFAGRSFRLDRGVIRFQGETPPDPTLDISADAQLQGIEATVRVGGTSNKPEISFTSVPALPQDELLSRLLFGTSITNLAPADALQLAAAVNALRSGGRGLDPLNSLRRAVGLDRLRVLPADVASGQKTALSAGKYLGRKLFVEVITDGQGYSATRIEYQITRWLSLLSSVSTIGRTSANLRVSKDY